MFKTALEVKELKVQVEDLDNQLENAEEQVEQLQKQIAQREVDIKNSITVLNQDHGFAIRQLQSDNENKIRVLVQDQADVVRKLEFKLDCANKEKELAIDAALNALRKEMQEALVTSDLKRVESTSALSTYEKMDTKDERKKLSDILDKAISGLCTQAKVTIVGAVKSE